ncbi:MAG: MarR family transcriptional regulator [Pontiellaceae bacterium]|nr:MarR family transcriptional regulator [Pontiellaceae bacterium]
MKTPAHPSSEPGPPVGNYASRILKALRRIIRAVDIDSKKLNQQHLVTGPQMVCLDCLHKYGTMTQSELARRVDLGMSTITGIIDRLEARGRVTRTRSATDRRRIYVDLTDDGRRQATAPALLQQRLATALSELPATEQNCMAKTLEQIVELLDAVHLDTARNLFPEAHIIENGEHT